MPTRRQRISRFRPICPECGNSRFEPSEGSMIHDEISVMDAVRATHADGGSIRVPLK
jgi:hypothetical protein